MHLQNTSSTIQLKTDILTITIKPGTIKTMPISYGISFNAEPIIQITHIQQQYNSRYETKSITTSGFNFIEGITTDSTGTRTVIIRWIALGT